jgi:hypothetical protein
MRLLVSGSTVTVARLAQQWPDHLGQLLTPKNRSTRSVTQTGLPWGLDNGAFSGFDPESFQRRLAWAGRHPARCLWAVCPDIVADAAATLRLFWQWHPNIRAAGLPVAFVGQDGAEGLDLPWDYFDCWFVGGSTRWKLSTASQRLMRQAKERGLWVHVGRVNSLRRLTWCYDCGADSCDGSSMSRYGDKYIHTFYRWLRRIEGQRLLWQGES